MTLFAWVLLGQGHGMQNNDHRQAETPSKPAPHLRQVASLKTPCNGHAGLLTCKRWRRRATAVGYAVVRVLPMTWRNSAVLRLRQSLWCVADTSWCGRSELARLNPTLTQVLLP